MRNLRNCQNLLKRCYTTGGAKTPGASAPATSNVKGLSSNCVKPVSEPVGPGASPTGQYKVPEYFCFNRFSFAEAEIEMAKYRCPQPTADRK
ncbi:uncharacterized protein NdufV3 [Calliphora vicina]|uniref:uncharacterized protein NdufV3 n=1 Tax=Calliphora vicina TaxID=7373 RepID=UPI00325C1674